MGQQLGGSFVVALDRAPAQRDAGGEDHAVVAQRGAAAQAHGFRHRVDALHPIMHHGHAAGAQAIEGMGDVGHAALAGQHQVPIGAGDEAALRLHQRHVEPGIGDAGEARGRGTTEPAADHQQARGALGAGDGGHGKGGGGGRGEETTP